MATTTYFKQLYIAMTVLTITMAVTVPMGVITSDMDGWEGMSAR